MYLFFIRLLRICRLQQKRSATFQRAKGTDTLKNDLSCMDVISEAKNIEGEVPLIPISPDVEPVTARIIRKGICTDVPTFNLQCHTSLKNECEAEHPSTIVAMKYQYL